MKSGIQSKLEGKGRKYSTMTGLIMVNEDMQTVSARELYNLISGDGGVKGTERFSKWFERYCSYGFSENEDFVSVKKSTEVQNNGGIQIRELVDYDLSLDMAKQICMLQRTEKGKQCRQYLIDLEKAWNTPEQVMARALKIADRKIENLTVQNSYLVKDINRMKPKEIFADAVAASHSSILIGEMAKILRQNGIDTGEKRLFHQLRQEKYLISRNGTDYNMPTQRSMELSLFEIKERTINNPDGSIRITKTVLVTGKGQQYFINKFMKDCRTM